MLTGQEGGEGLCDRLVGHGPFAKRVAFVSSAK